MTRTQALVGLNMVPDIGSTRLSKLREVFGTPENIFKADYEQLIRIFGIGEEIALKITSFKQGELDKEFKLAKERGLKIITLEDKDYPDNLKDIPGAPIVLYVKGELKQDDKFSIGIVGSRRASFYGLTSAEKFAYALSEKGLTIISGMARGIDTYAHKGALKAGGRTIAVMGSGFNHIYPEENQKLAEEISRNGAVISEFPINTIPFKQNFPRRNRIISGLSLGILVAEAAQNSGALITADFALEQGREVFALPGKVDSSTSFGTNELIKQGAKLVTNIDDILVELVLPLSNVKKVEQDIKSSALDKAENELYDLITEESVELDELAEKTNIDIPRISGILLRLQLKNLIKQLPGKQFIRICNER